MKKLSILIFLGAFLLLVPTANAGTWLAPGSAHDPFIVGNCTLVNTSSEADSTHVYTLNPDHTKLLDDAYSRYWQRHARCDELQFQIDHNTPLSRLNSWLDGVAKGWYDNIGTTHFNNQTVSTSQHEWFFIKDGVAYRVHDILTGWSWGLLIGDRISIPPQHTQYFYNTVTFGNSLHFSGGTNADKINNIWKNEDRNFSSLPTRLADQITMFHEDARASGGYGSIFEVCTFQSTFPGDPFYSLLDWSWTQRNPGCPL